MTTDLHKAGALIEAKTSVKQPVRTAHNVQNIMDNAG